MYLWLSNKLLIQNNSFESYKAMLYFLMPTCLSVGKEVLRYSVHVAMQDGDFSSKKQTNLCFLHTKL